MVLSSALRRKDASSLAGASPASVGLADAVKPKDDRQTALVQGGGKALGDKEQVALHQPDGNRVAGCFQDAKAGCLGDGLFAAALLLLCLECRIRRGPLLAGVVNGAIGIRAHLMNGADVAAFGDDGVGGELAHLELRALGIFLLLWACRRGSRCTCCAAEPDCLPSARRRPC